MVRPGVIFEKLKLICPVCETELTTDKCSKCGQLIDLDNLEVSVCPAEVLSDHRDIEVKTECEKCEYVCDTPLGSYCTLTNEPVGTTRCHYDEQKDFEVDIMKEVSR